MKFKTDENLPAEFAVILAGVGFEAATVADEGLSGTADSFLLDRCGAEERVLVTLDLDFANVQAHPVGRTPGLSSYEAKPRISRR